MNQLSRVLIVYSQKPPIIDYLETAFNRSGITASHVYANKSTWFDKWIIHPINKQMHNFRVLPKNQNLFENHPLAHKNYRSANLAKKVAEFKADLVLLIRGLNFNTSTLEGISPLFGWWIESEERMEEAFRESHLFDWYFFMNRSCVDAARQRGINHVSYLGHSVDLDAFYAIPGCRKQFDICFVGGWTRKRQEVIEAALEITPSIAIYGSKWLKNNLLRPKILRCIKGRYIEGKALVQLYNESRIVLNITNWGIGEGTKRSGMTMRVMEVPATGAFLLTDGSRELEEFFSPGQHLAVYRDKKDLAGKIAYYLLHETEREQIAQSGMEYVRRHYSYDTVVQNIIQTFGNLPLQSRRQDNQGTGGTQFTSRICYG